MVLRKGRVHVEDMTIKTDLSAEWGPLYDALSAAFAAGNRDAFIETLDRVGEARQAALYQELRELSGSLRFALDQFRLDSRLATLAGKDVPDARVRLDHALKLTEDGAHRTLDLVERSCPLAEYTAKQAGALVASLRAVRGDVTAVAGVTGGAGVTPLDNVLGQIADFLAVAQRDSDTVRANLTEVLMAQSYQDLSGQIIRGVITLVGEVERTLAHFAALAGGGTQGKTAGAAVETPNSAQGFGPAVPGLTKDAVGEQGDVDALLADLGM
jgi:chemotaxis protein CheZ